MPIQPDLSVLSPVCFSKVSCVPGAHSFYQIWLLPSYIRNISYNWNVHRNFVHLWEGKHCRNKSISTERVNQLRSYPYILKVLKLTFKRCLWIIFGIDPWKYIKYKSIYMEKGLNHSAPLPCRASRFQVNNFANTNYSLINKLLNCEYFKWILNELKCKGNLDWYKENLNVNLS